jgi:hypothetical protein
MTDAVPAIDWDKGDGLLPVIVQPGPQFVEPVPSTIELPKGTMVPISFGLCTSTALTRYVDVTVWVNAAPDTSATWLPAPGAVT